MEVIGLDPRDQTWEVDSQKYRVYFHRDGGRVSYEYELAGIDIDAVMAWANINRDGRRFVIHACVPDGELFTAVTDPDQPGAWHLSWDTGPIPGYGYMTRRSDHQWADPADLIGGVRNFLAEIDPKTGYLEV